MKHITVRNVEKDLARALDAERKRRGASLNQTVKDLLRRALAVGADAPYSNGLSRLAGGWSEEDLRAFEAAVAGFQEVDRDLWR
jgi:plasmid stability protein